MDRTILLVDEATRTRMLLASILRRLGFAVLECGDGREALDRIRTGRPDLVIIEAMLPFMSGFEVCAVLRRDPEFKGLPVLMMCSLSAGLGRESGGWREHVPADDFITKPFGLSDLITRIGKLIGPVPSALPVPR